MCALIQKIVEKKEYIQFVFITVLNQNMNNDMDNIRKD